MTSTCPDCGASMEFEQRDVRLRTGVCPGCAKEFAFVEGAEVSSRLRVPSPGTEGEAEEEGNEAATAAPGGPECEECGSPLTFREGHRGSIEAVCEECKTTTVYVPRSGRPPPEREHPPRLEEEGPRGRPCRRCGSPLQFSTGEDGLLVGECASCGNRFTLPPRPDRGRGYGGPSRYGGGDFRRGPGARTSFRDRGGRRSSRPFRRPDRRERSDFDDRERSRKRRRPREE